MSDQIQQTIVLDYVLEKIAALAVIMASVALGMAEIGSTNIECVIDDEEGGGYFVARLKASGLKALSATLDVVVESQKA